MDLCNSSPFCGTASTNMSSDFTKPYEVVSRALIIQLQHQQKFVGYCIYMFLIYTLDTQNVYTGSTVFRFTLVMEHLSLRLFMYFVKFNPLPIKPSFISLSNNKINSGFTKCTKVLPSVLE